MSAAVQLPPGHGLGRTVNNATRERREATLSGVAGR